MHTAPVYSDDDEAALYDLLNPWEPSDDFYLSYVLAASSALDVGCGTGRLLHRAREAGHRGRLVFGTRNPRVRAWQGWNPANPIDVVDHRGRELRILYRVEAVAGDVVTFTETTATRDGRPLRGDRASLRFLDVEGVETALAGAGFQVAAWYGDWSRGPLTEQSDDIVVVAVAAEEPHGG